MNPDQTAPDLGLYLCNIGHKLSSDLHQNNSIRQAKIMNLDETAHRSDLIHIICNIGHENTLSRRACKYFTLKCCLYNFKIYSRINIYLVSKRYEH